jgi:preprotein translocase subunit YajC
MFTSTAYAQTAGGSVDLQTQLLSVAPYLLIGLVFYFLLMRPQQQRTKQLAQQQKALRRGDRVVTAGGIVASVSRVLSDEEVELQIAEGVRVKVIRSTISTILAKTEPVGKSGKEPAAEEEAPPEEPADKKRRPPAAK